MTDNHRYNQIVFFTLILFVGLGLALALPWLANSQRAAAQSEVDTIADFKAFLIHGKEFKASPVESAQLVPDQDHVPEATRYYVAQTGSGADPTGGWNTAAKTVQDALALANITGGGEIWVAAGVYYPDQGVGQIDKLVSSTFVLGEDVALYGGFDTSDTTFSDRDWEANLTVLSGDIDGDDTQTDGVVNNAADINGDNAYHVVSSSGVSGTVVLDGFTVTAGQANGGSTTTDVGGGFYCDGSGSGNKCNPSLSNIIFSGNYALFGGAMYNNGREGSSSPSLTNVTFYGNYAVENGGALHNNGSYTGNSSPSLSNVTFSGNSVDGKGGAMYNNGSNNGGSSPSLEDVNFCGNSAEYGGALYNDGKKGTSSPSLEKVTFSSNSASNNGGAMYNNGEQGDSNPALINVTFSGNSADSSGGAMFNQGRDLGYSSPSLKNVLFSGNSANYGGAIYNYVNNGTSFPILSNVTFSGNSAGKDGGAIYNDGRLSGLSSAIVRNSIMWNNKDINGIGTITAAIYNASTTTKLIHSIVQGSFPGGSWIGGSYVDGGGNIDEDPMFVTPVDLSSVPTSDGNLRLQTGSPAIDAGDNTYIAGIPTDLDGEPRIVDGDMDGTPTVDMGAYEFGDETYIPLIFR